MFSVPLNPKLSETEFHEFVDFLTEQKSVIYDFYFTSRIPPFLQDAMGDVFLGGRDDHQWLLESALHIQEVTGIKASATFNNINVPPTQRNLELFIREFAPLYEAGIHSATIPHTHWVATKQIQKAFPNLLIKNTILRNVSDPRDIEGLAKAGFHYINLDRDLMRDHEKLLRFKKAKEMFGVKLSILANEGCLGGCIMMDEHYEFNNSRSVENPQYFTDPISRVSCPKWDFEDLAVPLKTANLPPWREDWEEMFSTLGIDVIKMHGRESVSRLKETVAIVRNYSDKKEILFEHFSSYIEEVNVVDRPIDVWRKKIKTCKFDCWDCHYCDKIIQNKYGDNRNRSVLNVTNALVESVGVDLQINIPGLTSTKVQSLLNGLAKNCNSYLEVGSFLGATAAAVLKDNKLNAYFVDNWEQNIQPAEADITMPDSNKNDFLLNIKQYIGANNVMVLDQSLLSVDVEKIEPIDLFFYDGPHNANEVVQAVRHFSKVFNEECILVFDDANWSDTKIGVDEALDGLDFNVIYSKQILNSIESKTDWWNGLYILVVKRKSRSTKTEQS
jgi:hypothetical protein